MQEKSWTSSFLIRLVVSKTFPCWNKTTDVTIWGNFSEIALILLFKLSTNDSREKVSRDCFDVFKFQSRKNRKIGLEVSPPSLQEKNLTISSSRNRKDWKISSRRGTVRRFVIFLYCSVEMCFLLRESCFVNEAQLSISLFYFHVFPFFSLLFVDIATRNLMKTKILCSFFTSKSKEFKKFCVHQVLWFISSSSKNPTVVHFMLTHDFSF